MPGIITHNRVFFESINILKKDKKTNIFSNSIEALLKSHFFMKAGLFGAMGPNIFNYLPFKKNNYISGSDISYSLHSERSDVLLKSMINTLLAYKDKNNEWSSTQRAYLYGFISHLIADSIFHPFIYYWSGLPSSANKKDRLWSREQHLLFEYNMDLYFSNSYNENENGNKFIFNLDEMMPVRYQGRSRFIDPSIKILLINTVKEVLPDFYKKVPFSKGDNIKRSPIYFFLDIIPFMIKLSYRVKTSRNTNLMKIIKYIKRKNIFPPDYILNYPSASRINTHILNLHKERWFHPSGVAGLHYESVNDLLQAAGKRIAGLWQKIEEMIFLYPKKIRKIENELKINTFTGILGKDINSMHLQQTNRLRF